MLEIGKIVNTHGLRGEIKVVYWTDYAEVFEEIQSVFIDKKGNVEEYKIKNVKYQKNNIILKLEGIDSIEDAEKLKNKVLSTSREQLGELEDGAYYIADLIGISVYDDSNNLIGKISDVLQTGSNDVYVVKREGAKDLLLPVIDDVVLNIDIEGKRIDVHVMEGLEEL